MMLKKQHKIPAVFIVLLLLLLLIYNFSYLFPFTNNAFVVANTRPVAANVSGYITQLYVKNEMYVTKGQPLFTVFQTPYRLAYEKAQSDVMQAQAYLNVLSKRIEKTRYLMKAEQARDEKLMFDLAHYQSALHDDAVSQISVHTIRKNKLASENTLNALKAQLDMNQQQVIVQKNKISSLTAVMKNAKVDLDETTVYAQNNGFIQNMYTALGAPIEKRKPIFSFIDTDHFYLQANLSEIDLRRVRAGDKVTIYPRIYIGSKHYHGIITSTNWAASRQITDPRSQQQIVANNEDNWILLPQRFPVQIEITDYDPKHYPLGIGASAYIYIHTHS
jgi:multidrug resistance efflux pump